MTDAFPTDGQILCTLMMEVGVESRMHVPSPSSSRGQRGLAQMMMPPPLMPKLQEIDPSAAVAVPLHHDHDQAVDINNGVLVEERRRRAASSRSTKNEEEDHDDGSYPPRRTTTAAKNDDGNGDPSEEEEEEGDHHHHVGDDEQQPQRQSLTPTIQNVTGGGSAPPGTSTPEDTPPERTSTSSTVHYKILAFYKFQSVQVDELETWKDELVQLFRQHDAMGNVLLAVEGINGTVCYPAATPRSDDDGLDDDVVMLTDPIQQYLLRKFPNPMMRVSHTTGSNVFWRLRVRIKSEVVTMGVPDLSLVGGSAAGDPDNAIDRPEDDADDPSTDPQSDHGDNRSRRCSDGGSCADMPGKYVSPHEWNDVLRDPSTLVIDTRNTYEVELGTFQGAVNPHTTSFVEFPHWLENQLLQERRGSSQSRSDLSSEESTPPNPSTNITKLAFFCTGGVRCEKATAYAQRLLKEHQRSRRDGLESPASPMPEVLHLQGGILAYLETVSPHESMFVGECYVFDNRVAVSHGLQPTQRYVACKACRHPLSKDEWEQDDYVEGRQCKYCVDDPDRQLRRDRYEMRHQNVVAAQQLGVQHLGSNSVDATRAKCRAEIKKKVAAAAAALAATTTATTAGADP